MGFIHLRKAETQQQQQQQLSNSNNNNSAGGIVATAATSSGCTLPHHHHHHNVTAPTLSSLNKQTKTHNNTLISSTSNVATAGINESKIPVVRSSAVLIDAGVSRAAASSSGGGIGSSATIPPSRGGTSRAPHHHMTLRGRSRIRYHRTGATAATATMVEPPCTTVTARYYRDVSAIPSAAASPLDAGGGGGGGGGVGSTRSVSATLDLNSNPLQDVAGSSAAFLHSKVSQSTSLPKSHMFYQRHHHHQHHGSSPNKNNSNSNSNNNNNNNNYNNNNSMNVQLNENLRSTPPLDTNRLSNNNNCGRNSFDAVIAATTTGARVSPTGIPTGITKRNKRSLSSTRLEKDKCDEYNTKLLRKATGNNNAAQSNSNVCASGAAPGNANTNNNNANSNNQNLLSCSTGRDDVSCESSGSGIRPSGAAVSGGGYRTRHHMPSATATANSTLLESSTASSGSSASTSGIPTPTAATTAHGLYLQRGSGARYAAAAALAVERERETTLKLRKKISY